MKMEKAIKIYDKPLYIQKMKFDDNMMSITEKVIAYQVEKMDDFICESIIECLPDDVTKVLFLDKNKIAEIFRRQVNNGWIPVSERLPNEEECSKFKIMKLSANYRMFLCTIKIADYEPQTRELYFSEITGWKYGAEDYNQYVTAWMPLPEAYKEDKHEL